MKNFWIVLLASALLGAGGCGRDAPEVESPEPRAESLPMIQVSDRIWYFQGESGMASVANKGFMSNAGFVVTREGVVVFDALATPALSGAMLAGIRSVTEQPVVRVIVSHYHADHVYGLQVFQDLGAEIWAREEGKGYIQSDSAAERLVQRRRDLSPWINDQTRLVAADRWLSFEKGAYSTFELGGIVFGLINGGSAHAPDDLMMFVGGDKVLFAGDLFFTGRLPFVEGGNTRQWLRALDRIEKSGANAVIPGHGSVSRNVSDDLANTRRYLHFLRDELGAAVEDLEAFDEAYDAIDWSTFSSQPTFDQANRRNAYSVFLELQQEMLDASVEAAR